MGGRRWVVNENKLVMYLYHLMGSHLSFHPQLLHPVVFLLLFEVESMLLGTPLLLGSVESWGEREKSNPNMKIPRQFLGVYSNQLTLLNVTFIEHVQCIYSILFRLQTRITCMLTKKQPKTLPLRAINVN